MLYIITICNLSANILPSPIRKRVISRYNYPINAQGGYLLNYIEYNNIKKYQFVIFHPPYPSLKIHLR